MTKQEAINALADGHTIYAVEFAEDVCKTLGIEFLDQRLVKKFYSDPPGTHKGLTMKKEGDKGVYSLTLSHEVARQLGVADQAGSYYGRGSQARAYAREIAKALKVETQVEV